MCNWPAFAAIIEIRNISFGEVFYFFVGVYGNYFRVNYQDFVLFAKCGQFLQNIFLAFYFFGVFIKKNLVEKVPSPMKNSGILMAVIPQVDVPCLDSFFLECIHNMMVIIPEIETNKADLHECRFGKSRKFKQFIMKPYL